MSERTTTIDAIKNDAIKSNQQYLHFILQMDFNCEDESGLFCCGVVFMRNIEFN